MGKLFEIFSTITLYMIGIVLCIVVWLMLFTGIYCLVKHVIG